MTDYNNTWCQSGYMYMYNNSSAGITDNDQY